MIGWVLSWGTGSYLWFSGWLVGGEGRWGGGEVGRGSVGFSYLYIVVLKVAER